MVDIVTKTDHYDKVLKEYLVLRNQMIDLVGKKESLLKHKFYELKINYLTKIGKLEHELLDIDIRLGLVKRKIELTQTYMKNQGYVNVSMVESKVNYEFQELFDFLEANEKEIRIAKYFSSVKKLSEDEFNELNRYFKNIISLLYPDINTGLTETQKSLWKKAKLAYENDEIGYLKIIYKLANDEALNTVKIEDYTLEDLLLGISHMENKIIEVLDEIYVIENNFPFNKEELLNNQSKIKEVQNELRRNIEEGSSILKILENHYLMMLDKNVYIN